MINDKTFLLSKTPWQTQDYKTIRLANGWFLNHHKTLDVLVTKNRRICLLGIAWTVDCLSNSGGVFEKLNNLEKYFGRDFIDHLIETEITFCGKYIIIADNRIYMDAVGMMSCYYSDYAISNSITVLCSYIKKDVKYPHYYEKSEGMYYVVGSSTPVEDIRRLLPSMIYDYVNQELIGRQLITKVYQANTRKERKALISKFIECFDSSLKNMSSTIEGNIWISLTGGRDSRALLSMMEHSGLDYSCFNYGFNGISEGDVVIPAEICDKLQRKFIHIKRDESKYSQKKKDDFERHCAGYANEECWNAYAYGQFDEITKKGKTIILDSGLWEIATDRYEWLGKNPCADDYKQHYPNVATDVLLQKNIDDYFEWIESTPQNLIKKSDRIYWELCDGCWLSGLEQAYDILDNTTHLQPLNSRMFFEILFSFSNSIRMDKKLEEKITIIACASLKDLDYEDRYLSSVEILRKQLKYILHRMGLLNHFRKMRHKL